MYYSIAIEHSNNTFQEFIVQAMIDIQSNLLLRDPPHTWIVHQVFTKTSYLQGFL